MRRVIFIHSKFPVHSAGISDLLTRWNIYGRLVHERSKDDGIWIFSIKIPKNLEKLYVEHSYIRTFESIPEKSNLEFFSSLDQGFKNLDGKNESHRYTSCIRR
jgi:hypothetical protein